MLVLSRQKDESIIIGEGEDAIEVMICDIRGDKVRLGIKAPKNVMVHRSEIYKKVQERKAKEAKRAQVTTTDQKELVMASSIIYELKTFAGSAFYADQEVAKQKAVDKFPGIELNHHGPNVSGTWNGELVLTITERCVRGRMD